MALIKNKKSNWKALMYNINHIDHVFFIPTNKNFYLITKIKILSEFINIL